MPQSHSPLTDAHGQGSSQHQSVRRERGSAHAHQRLDRVALEDRGELLEDHQRDRRSSGRAHTDEDEG